MLSCRAMLSTQLRSRTPLMACTHVTGEFCHDHGTTMQHMLTAPSVNPTLHHQQSRLTLASETHSSGISLQTTVGPLVQASKQLRNYRKLQARLLKCPITHALLTTTRSVNLPEHATTLATASADDASSVQFCRCSMDIEQPLSRRRAEMQGSCESLAASSPSHSMELKPLPSQQSRPAAFAQACHRTLDYAQAWTLD